MKLFFKILLLVTPLFVTGELLAHGEDKLGPNKGYIRMPGAFHTEVVPSGNSFKVYLIDIQFKNPTIKESSVEFNLIQNKTETKGQCTSSKDHFICTLLEGKDLKTGELTLKAIRGKMQGGLAKYKLPLAVVKHH